MVSDAWKLLGRAQPGLFRHPSSGLGRFGYATPLQLQGQSGAASLPSPGGGGPPSRGADRSGRARLASSPKPGRPSSSRPEASIFAADTVSPPQVYIAFIERNRSAVAPALP